MLKIIIRALRLSNILYIGNFLTEGNRTPGTNELIVQKLKEKYKVYYASSKKSEIQRLFDMLFLITSKGNKNSIILIDTFSSKAFYFAFASGLLSRFYNIKFILILHGGDLPKRLNSRISRYLFKLSFMNVAVSPYLYSAFFEKGIRNITLINNPIDLDKYLPIQKNYEAPQLLWVRSLHEVYNPMMAIRVLNELIKFFPKSQLIMVGPDKSMILPELLNEVSRLGLNEHITFTGLLSKSAWIQLSQKSNIFINTTTIDNTPISVIEALALGFPVISTNVGGIPFLLKHEVNGLLVNSGDVSAMVKEIEKVLQDSKFREQLILNGLELAKSYSWDFNENKWHKLIEDAVQ